MSSETTLTLDVLRRALEDTEMPRWRRMIEEAERVQVQPTQHGVKGTIYVMHPPSLVPGIDTPPLLVICHHDDHATAAEIVAHIRQAGGGNHE